MVIKVVNAGNCILCGKPIELKDTKDTDKFPDIFFCQECEKKVRNKNGRQMVNMCKELKR